VLEVVVLVLELSAVEVDAELVEVLVRVVVPVEEVVVASSMVVWLQLTAYMLKAPNTIARHTTIMNFILGHYIY